MLNELIKSKHELLRMYERHEIDDETFNGTLLEIEELLSKEQQNALNLKQQQNDKKLITPTEIIPPNPKAEKLKKGDVILEILQKSTTQDVYDAASELINIFTDMTKDQALALVRSTISFVKHQRGKKFSEYVLNEDGVTIRKK